MGLTERHWFENEEPELTERQLEDIVYENKRAYDSGYAKGYSARDNEIVRCKDCIYGKYEKNDSTGMEWIYCQHHRENRPEEWFCASSSRMETIQE